MQRSSSAHAAALVLCALGAACGSKTENQSGSPIASAAGSASASASVAAKGAALPPAPPSPFSVALESKGALTFSGLLGGVWINDEARAHVARAPAGGELTAVSMPEGLPSGAGRILGASGKLPGPIWVSYEKLKDDGKAESTPLYRLMKDQWKLVAEDWSPQISAWSKNRILSASTSSGKLKIKVLDPGLAAAPDDLPVSARRPPSGKGLAAGADLWPARTRRARGR
jgi:hypothetical protein